MAVHAMMGGVNYFNNASVVVMRRHNVFWPSMARSIVTTKANCYLWAQLADHHKHEDLRRMVYNVPGCEALIKYEEHHNEGETEAGVK